MTIFTRVSKSAVYASYITAYQLAKQKKTSCNWQKFIEVCNEGCCKNKLLKKEKVKIKLHLHRRPICKRFFDKKWIWQSCFYSIVVLIMIMGALQMEIIVLRCFHSDIVIIENFERESVLR